MSTQPGQLHWFVVAADRKGWFDEQAANALKRTFRKILHASYVDNPDKIASGLLGYPSYLLARLSWGLDRLRNGEFSGLPFEGWPEFASTILESARRDPRTMLPQVACVIVRHVDKSDGSRDPQFERALAARLFGESHLRAVFTSESVAELDRASRVVAAALSELDDGRGS